MQRECYEYVCGWVLQPWFTREMGVLVFVFVCTTVQPCRGQKENKAMGVEQMTNIQVLLLQLTCVLTDTHLQAHTFSDPPPPTHRRPPTRHIFTQLTYQLYTITNLHVNFTQLTHL